MDSFLAQLEQSGLATWIHESGSIYGYPLILFLHTLGLGTLVGLNTAIDLRLLGFAPGVPLKSLERTFGLMWAGFAVNATTGSLLFIADATKHFSNPAFFVKLACVALAVIALTLIRSRVFRGPLLDEKRIRRTGRILAIVSLSCWFIALSSGRLMAYIAEYIS
jgi:hypothetical protein